MLIEALDIVFNNRIVSLKIAFGNKYQALGWVSIQHPHGPQSLTTLLKSPTNQHSLGNSYCTTLFITFQQQMQEHYSLQWMFSECSKRCGFTDLAIEIYIKTQFLSPSLRKLKTFSYTPLHHTLHTQRACSQASDLIMSSESFSYVPAIQIQKLKSTNYFAV
jgi:hypothetical protein